MAQFNSGTDTDLVVQATNRETGVPVDLTKSDILAYGVILFLANGTEIARYSSNATALGVPPWELQANIELEDGVNGQILLHVDKEITIGITTQFLTARVLIQRDATLHGDDHHVDNETWSAAEAEIIQITGSKDDSVITMT